MLTLPLVLFLRFLIFLCPESQSLRTDIQEGSAVGLRQPALYIRGLRKRLRTFFFFLVYLDHSIVH